MKKRLLLLFLVALCLAFGVSTLVACNFDELGEDLCSTHMLTYEVDGEEYLTIRTDGMKTIRLPAEPQKDGYEFAGWYFDDGTWLDEFTASSFETVSLGSNITVYARWLSNNVEERTYNVFFDTQGYGNVTYDGERVSYINVGHGEALQWPTPPMNYDNMSLVRWSTSMEYSAETEWDFNADRVNEDTWLYAHWVPSEAARGMEITELGTLEADASGALYGEVLSTTESYSLDDDIEISPWADYVVIDKINGGEIVSLDGKLTLNYGRNDYSIRVYSGNYFAGINRSGFADYDITLYRRQMFTVTFEMYDDIKPDRNIDEDQVFDEATIAALENIASQRPGYIFEGWTYETNVAGNTVMEDWNPTSPINSSMTVYAAYTPKVYSVSFDATDGSTIYEEPIEIAYDSQPEEAFRTPDSRNHYIFEGWYYGDEQVTDGEGKLLNAWHIDSDSEIVLTAVWSSEQYSISYYFGSNHADTDMNRVQNDNPNAYTVKDAFSLQDPVLRGYTFEGWYADEDMTIPATTDIYVPEGADAESLALTFYGRFAIINYEITYIVNEEEGVAPSNNPASYNIEEGAAELPGAESIVLGYKFNGWMLNGRRVSGISPGTVGDIELTAEYTPIEYHINYCGNDSQSSPGGTHNNPVSYYVTSGSVGLSEATRNGYEFAGWYIAGTSERVTAISSDLIPEDGDTIYLHADWSAILYTANLYGFDRNEVYASVPFTVEDTITIADILLGAEKETPSAKGYDFDTWELAGHDIDEGYNISTGVYNNVNIYARFEEKVYQIVYDLRLEENQYANPNIGTFTVSTIGGADGSVLLNPAVYLASYSANAAVGTFTVSDMEFLGWKIAGSSDDDYVDHVDINMIEDGNSENTVINLEAAWGDPENNEVQYVRVDKEGNYNTNASYVLFGYYPQSEVDDSAIISSLNETIGSARPNANNLNGWTSYGYVANSGEIDMWYRDVVSGNDKYRAVYFTEYRTYRTVYTPSSENSYQDDNGYYAQRVYWFKFEPIMWSIADRDEEGNLKLLSCSILDAQNYGNTTSAYDVSAIRNWLNDEFILTSFGDSQRGIIMDTEVDNSASSTGVVGNQNASTNTTDKVFLMSYQEAVSLSGYPVYGASSLRSLGGTDYFRIQGGNSDNEWLLRSPYHSTDTLASGWLSLYVNGDGSVSVSNAMGIDNTSMGVVPALWLDVSPDSQTSAD